MRDLPRDFAQLRAQRDVMISRQKDWKDELKVLKTEMKDSGFASIGAVKKHIAKLEKKIEKSKVVVAEKIDEIKARLEC